ncbi:hypothetical protein [Bergeyella sp. RCAD1439]|uniref:hypothetical protein n=1 Tax=Bergeyella anatis TaxID=3113737 RepID=UPI002E16E1C8|nr:hypothetical protein [Bergeyella sp. RCAD1439]
MSKFIMLLFCLSIFACNYQKSTENNVGWRDFGGIDSLKMKGVVSYINKDIGNGYHGRGIIGLNLLETNINFYDPSQKQDNYYCIIKKNRAEVYDNNLRDMHIGDTIFIDTKTQIISWTNKNDEKFEYSISIGEPSFFKFIKENNLQKIK